MQMFLPTESNWRETRLGRFVEHQGFASLEELQSWAVRMPTPFWRAVADEVGLVRASEAIRPDARDPDRGGFERAGFCPHRSLLGRHAERDPQRLALRAPDLAGSMVERSYSELSADVARLSAGLARSGVGCGERVALALPTGLEAVTALLALICRGAHTVLSCCRDDAAAGRGAPAGCRWLIAGDDAATAAVSRSGAGRECTPLAYSSLLAAANAGLPPEPAAGARLEVACPLSHDVAGLTLKAAWDLATALDLNQGERLRVHAEPAWPLWPWLVLGTLQLGAGLVIGARAQDDLAGVTHLGLCGATLQAALGEDASAQRVLDGGALRVLAIFDGRIDALAWNWLFQRLGHCRFPLVSCFASAESGGLLLAAFPGLPVKPCALVGPLPGVDIGLNIATGDRAGELVCCNRWPGQPQPWAFGAPRPLGRGWIDADGYWFVA